METNKVMDLCRRGMAAEFADVDEARRLFRRAWDAREDDFDACIAAHYVARDQLTVETGLDWNEHTVQNADAVRDDRVGSFYPSLYLNQAVAYEETAQADEDYETVRRARENFALAAGRVAELPDGPYAEMIKSRSAAGLPRRRDPRVRPDRPDRRVGSGPMDAYLAGVVGPSDAERMSFVLTFGYSARPHDPEHHSAAHWIECADRLAYDQIVEEP